MCVCERRHKYILKSKTTAVWMNETLELLLNENQVLEIIKQLLYWNTIFRTKCGASTKLLLVVTLAKTTTT